MRHKDTGELDEIQLHKTPEQPSQLTGRARKMLKKLILGSMIAGGAGLLFLGPAPFSYVKTGYRSVRDTIRDQIPIDVEIKRARDLIENLKPEIASNLRIIAREEVEVAKLQREVQTKSENLAKSKTAILQLKGDLESGIKKVSYGGKTYSMDQVKTDLEGRFKQFQTQEATHAKLEGVLAAREKNLQAARQKLEAILSAKRQYEVTIENLQARWTMQQVAESTSQYSLNDSALSNVRSTLEDISTRLDVAEKMVELDIEEVGIPVTEELESTEDILDQITQHFGAEESAFEVVAAKPASALIPVTKDAEEADQENLNEDN